MNYAETSPDRQKVIPQKRYLTDKSEYHENLT